MQAVYSIERWHCLLDVGDLLALQVGIWQRYCSPNPPCSPGNFRNGYSDYEVGGALSVVRNNNSHRPMGLDNTT